MPIPSQIDRVPVIIPFYREREKLERCLAHLRAQTYPAVEIFVRDNTFDNVYFTAAVNEGLQKYCYDPAIRYVVVLNQDAYLAPDAIQVLVDFLENNPESGIACPLQLAAGGQVSWGGSLRAFPFGEHRCSPFESYTSATETYWANGAALVVRTQVVREVGLWDRNLRFIASDADFSFSARARGWKIHVVPAARCEHNLKSSAAGGSSVDVNLIKAKDALYFARKWVSGDLYKGLSYEGASLTRMGVRTAVEDLERYIECTAAQVERLRASNIEDRA